MALFLDNKENSLDQRWNVFTESNIGGKAVLRNDDFPIKLGDECKILLTDYPYHFNNFTDISTKMFIDKLMDIFANEHNLSLFSMSNIDDLRERFIANRIKTITLYITP